MSTTPKPLGVLAATVHVLDPSERVPVVLPAGTEVTDPSICEQITNPACWRGEPPAITRPSKAPRKTKAAQE